jgi:SAM-dependent MidA family methyltransferase
VQSEAKSKRQKMMANEDSALVDFIRAEIRARGPVTFRWFMEQALYHPAHGFYSSGRCQIGRSGDYFTNVSVGSLFGGLMARQFFEIWKQLGRPQSFTIVEQGAHDGDFAHDVLTEARAVMPEWYAALHYRIVEPFPILEARQRAKLDLFESKIEWQKSVGELESFIGVHFSNELFDAMPVHFVTVWNNQWQEKYVVSEADEFEFTDGPVSTERLREHLEKLPAPDAKYETEINLAALDLIEQLSLKLERGFILAVDYGYPREEFYSAGRTNGTLRVVAQHRNISSPLVDVGSTDISAHVDWTSMSEHAENCGLALAGFTDQHHYITALATMFLPNELAEPDRRALQTLLHPGLLGRTYQFLALAKDIPPVTRLTGFQFSRDPRAALGLSLR